jgi:hypothetical protein
VKVGRAARLEEAMGNVALAAIARNVDIPGIVDFVRLICLLLVDRLSFRLLCLPDLLAYIVH